MRDGVEYARDHGVGLAFLGANASYWQMRFEPDSAGVADRTIVCYKVQKESQNLIGLYQEILSKHDVKSGVPKKQPV